jgi:hypothetical protein
MTVEENVLRVLACARASDPGRASGQGSTSMAHHHGHNQQEQMLRQQQIWQWRTAMQAVYERLNAMPLADLAAEVMARAFGPGDPGYDDDAITVAHANRNAGPTGNETRSPGRRSSRRLAPGRAATGRCSEAT